MVIAIVLPMGGYSLLQQHSSGLHEALLDPVARLQGRIDASEIHFDFGTQRGYLDSLLEHFDIPIASQTLVFSKTSLQADLISPASPRALYFNDDVYVGWVPNGKVLEIAVVDPKWGPVFYTLEQQQTDVPTFKKEGSRCISCHLPSRREIPVPRLMVMSILPNSDGAPLGLEVLLTTDESPINRRWGGWYVTGNHGNGFHWGNVIIGEASWGIGEQTNRTGLTDRFDTSPYLNGSSDIVALNLLVHQSHIHNLIGEAAYAVRKVIEGQAADRSVDRSDPSPSDKTMARVAKIVEPLVRGLLFAGAAPLHAPIRGTSGFAEEFASQGIHDRRGRSLRDLDLQQRILRYPLSYLVYSDSFNRMPEIATHSIYSRLWEILTGGDRSPEFAHLSDVNRVAILEILQDTKPDFAAWVAKRRSAKD
jgi:hypothetical protein